jgi:hypothetical protein
MAIIPYHGYLYHYFGTVPNCTVPYATVSYRTVLYRTGTVAYSTVPYCTVLQPYLKRHQDVTVR